MERVTKEIDTSSKTIGRKEKKRSLLETYVDGQEKTVHTQILGKYGFYFSFVKCKYEHTFIKRAVGRVFVCVCARVYSQTIHTYDKLCSWALKKTRKNNGDVWYTQFQTLNHDINDSLYVRQQQHQIRYMLFGKQIHPTFKCDTYCANKIE